MPRLPPRANTHVDATGLIYGDDFNDSYFSRDNGLEESRTVFLQGCGLPEAWADRAHFVIGELGFGTGLNVLAAWDLWNKTKPKGSILHIITVEGFLLEAEAAHAAHKAWPELADLSAKLIAKWPTRAYGAQRIWFEDDGICLTILIGPCEDVLKRMDFKADCWFLDGFAPSRNPDMWSPEIFAQIARLSAPTARIGTYSVAGLVRNGLQEVGFTIERKPGFGTKRERLEGFRRFDETCGFLPRLTGEVPEGRRGCLLQASRLREETPPQSLRDSSPVRRGSKERVQPTSALVIGGGIGGAALAAALRKRGCQVDLIDSDTCGRTKASGNPVALIMPRLDKGDTREARFFRAAYLMANDFYHGLSEDCFRPSPVIEYGEDEQARKKLADTADDPPLPPEHLQTNEDGNLVHLRGGLVYPDRLLATLKSGARIHPVKVARLEQRDGLWCALNDHGDLIASAEICCVAAGVGVRDVVDLGLELGGRAGQLSFARLEGALPSRPVSGGGYAAPFGERLVFGATYDAWPLTTPQPPAVTEAAHRHNQSLLQEFVPDLAARIDLASASGRTSIRVTTPDQLPIAGRVPTSEQGLYVMAGLGSRGFTTAFLCAEKIVCEAFGEPSPMEIGCAEAIAPDRFAKRTAKRTTPKHPAQS